MAASTEQPPAFSVVIPSYRMAATLARTLASLQAQVCPQPFEILVVDSSADGSLPALRARFPDVVFVERAARTPASAARNLGVAHSTAPVVAFLDADVVASPGWALAVLRAMGEGVSVLAGPVLPSAPHSVAGLLLFLVEFAEFLPRRRTRTSPFAPSCNLVVRRDVLALAGGFPEELDRGEDLGLGVRLRDLGRVYTIDPALPVAHVNRGGVPEVVRHLLQLGTWSARARRRYVMRGSFLIGAPWLVLLLVPVRAARILGRVLIAPGCRWLLWIAGGLFPLLLASLLVWAAGFVRGSR